MLILLQLKSEERPVEQGLCDSQAFIELSALSLATIKC